ncbi:MAG TPA: hypothetical protein VN892_03215 [Solirubrobacteraceae bacterium]|nr:hypothetical protein [Solirubrobacteraceae bacterium]
MAYNANGQMAPGFPKWTTGWTMFSPAAGDLLSNGRSDLVTRPPGAIQSAHWYPRLRTVTFHRSRSDLV